MSSVVPTPPRLVESLADLQEEEFARRLALALARADLVELRLDRLPADALTRVAAGDAARVLATCRAGWEGGAWDGSEADRQAVLLTALDQGVGYIDVEWRSAWRDVVLHRAPERVVLSLHDFAGVPDDLAATVAAMAGTGAAVVKVAVTARRLEDVLRLRDAASAAAGRPIVTIAMGPYGVCSRLLPGSFGTSWTYAGDGVAPGQVAAATMRDVYRVGNVAGDAAIYGVAGRPIGHSLSPVLHNAALAARRIDAVYVPFEAADIDDLLDTAQALGVRGLSVTAPFKQEALARASEADAATRTIGAANTLTWTGNGWAATNTDVEGFLAPLRARRPLRGARVSVLGAGGAARAVVAGLAAEGAAVAVHARRPEQAASVATLGATVGPWPPSPDAWDVLVNTTPVGTSPQHEHSPLTRAELGARRDGTLVYDLVYNPARTRLLSEAAEAGAEVLGGLPMLVAQAAQQHVLWHGGPAPVDIMTSAVGRYAAHLVPHAEAACPE